jgi:hypothetical protein
MDEREVEEMGDDVGKQGNNSSGWINVVVLESFIDYPPIGSAFEFHHRLAPAILCAHASHEGVVSGEGEGKGGVT